MRSIVNGWLKDKRVSLLHPDVWPHENPMAVNCGVAETALTSVALGMANDRPVAVYGIAGFILLRAAEVLALYQPKHSIIILNAGHNGCYPANLGVGHQIFNDYDLKMCNTFGIKVLEPWAGRVTDENVEQVTRAVRSCLDEAINDPGWHLFRLGWDRR